MRNKAALTLITTGISPQHYGHQVLGASVAQTREMRGNLKGGTQYAGTNSCVTSTLAWLLGPTADPEIKIPTEQLDIWVQTWAAIDATERKETRKTWNKTLSNILQRGAIKATKGPVEATVMALMYLGWKPAAPYQWFLPQGEAVKLDGEAFT